MDGACLAPEKNKTMAVDVGGSRGLNVLQHVCLEHVWTSRADHEALAPDITVRDCRCHALSASSIFLALCVPCERVLTVAPHTSPPRFTISPTFLHTYTLPDPNAIPSTCASCMSARERLQDNNVRLVWRLLFVVFTKLAIGRTKNISAVWLTVQ